MPAVRRRRGSPTTIRFADLNCSAFASASTATVSVAAAAAAPLGFCWAWAACGGSRYADGESGPAGGV